MAQERYADFLRANRKFHDLITAQTGNSVLQEVLANLGARFWSIGTIVVSRHAQRAHDIRRENRAILDALAGGDLKTIEKAVRAHVKGAAERGALIHRARDTTSFHRGGVIPREDAWIQCSRHSNRSARSRGKIARAGVAQNAPGEGLLSRWIPAEDPEQAAQEQYLSSGHSQARIAQPRTENLVPKPQAQIGKTLKSDHAVGAVGKHALDIILDPGKVYVGVPVGAAVSEHLTDGTPFTLEVDNGKYFIGKKPAVLRDNGRWECVDDSAKPEKLMSVTIPPYPHYYDHHTSRGHSMRSIMPIAGDFGGATIFPHCHYFGRFVDDYRHTECRFCGIDENLESGRDIFPKRPDDFLETVAEARKYPYFRHGPVFAGGTTPPPDRGAKAHAKFLRPRPMSRVAIMG